MEGQIENIYNDIIATLATYGGTLEHVVREVIYTTDMDAFLNAAPVRKEFYRNYGLPATTCVGVARLAYPEFVVEIEATAILPHDVTF